MNSLVNQVIVITGSSRLFGYALAKEFLGAGGQVVISSEATATQ